MFDCIFRCQTLHSQLKRQWTGKLVFGPNTTKQLTKFITLSIIFNQTYSTVQTFEDELVPRNNCNSNRFSNKTTNTLFHVMTTTIGSLTSINLHITKHVANTYWGGIKLRQSRVAAPLNKSFTTKEMWSQLSIQLSRSHLILHPSNQQNQLWLIPKEFTKLQSNKLC